jgi:hypothetical protein
MNLREQIRRALNNEETKKLIKKIVRRIPDLDDVVRRTTEWAMVHYNSRLDDVSAKWFVETVIYNVYIDTITPIFEGWDEYNDEISFELSNKDAENILNFLAEHYFDVISDRFNKRYKDDSLNEEIQTDYAVIEILKPSSRMPSKWYFQAVPLNKTKEDKIYIKRGSAGTLTISTKNIKIHKTFKNSEKEEMDKYLEKLRDEDTKKGINESVNHWLRRRFDIDELDDLVKDVKDQMEEGQTMIDAIYDTVRQFIATKQFSDIDNAGTDQEYWNSYLVYEKPLIKFVKEKLESEKGEMKEEELTEKCWKGYTQKGMKTMFGKRYPNCVKKTK